MSRRVAIVLLVLCILLWARTAMVSVDYDTFAYVTRFGEPIDTYNGATDAGLHWKAPWPIDSVQVIDRRLQAFDLPAVESLTRDPIRGSVDKTLTVDAFVTWRIPDSDAADRFIRTVGTPEQARRLLAPQINGRLASVIATMPLTDLIGTIEVESAPAALLGTSIYAMPERVVPLKQQRIADRAYQLQQQLLIEESGESLSRRTLDQYGIEIVDLRIRRFSYPEAVRVSIAERIRSERAGKVEEYNSQGILQAQAIISDANTQAKAIEANAEAAKTRTIGTAMAEADRIRNDAQSHDPQFYEFLRKIEFYKQILSESRDVLLLSTKHPLFDKLLMPPRETR